jgi:hypothetical protein
MNRPLLGLLSAIALAALWTGVAPRAVEAECFPRPAVGTGIPIAYAFTATVLDLSTEVDQEAKDAGEGDGLIWHLELDVGHVYRGSVPARLSLTGHTLSHLSCSYFLGEQTRVGETLFVAVDDQVNIKSNTDLFGQLLLWQRVNDRWTFYESALRDGLDRTSYPNAARNARTTQQILAAIAPGAPNTAIVSAAAREPGEPSDVSLWIGLLATFGIAFFAYTRRVGSQSRRS